jgi:O-antigen ligase
MNEIMYSRSVLAVVVLATCVNFVSLPTGRDSRVVLSLAFAAVVCGLWLLRVLRGEARVAQSVASPVVAFVAVGAFSWIWSKLTADALLWIWPSFSMVQIAALLVNALLPLMLLLTASVVRSQIWSERFVLLLVVVGVASLATRTFSLPIAVMLDNGTRGLFVAWSTGAAALLIFFRWRSSAMPWRAASVLLLVGNIYHYFFLHRLWMSGWLPMLAAIFCLAWLRSWKFGVAASTCGLVLAMLFARDLYETIVVDNQREGGLQRIELWMMNLQHVANHPVFGLGPAGYAPYNMTYHPRDARSTHNNYFDVLAQTGVVGAACFVWLLASIGRGAWRVYTRASPQSFERGYAALALAVFFAALGAMMLGDWVLPFAYNQSITGFDNAVISWIGWGLTLGAISRNRRLLRGET